MPAFKYVLIIFLKILFLQSFANVDSLRKASFFTIRPKTKTTTEPRPSTTEPPVHVPYNPVNQTLADMFATHIRYQSVDLFALSKKSTSFDLLKETYNTKLRREVTIKPLNTAKMIREISTKLSQELGKTTGVVQNLTDFVEKVYVEYKYNIKRVNESLNHVYYDSKSPKTFCDISEELKRRKSPDGLQRSRNNNNHWVRGSDDFSSSYDYSFSVLEVSNGSMVLNQSMQSRSASTGAIFEEAVGSYQYQANKKQLRPLFWDVECINRTSVTSFRKERKINLDESTIQVPTNIFKQTMAINMTAYWTKSLNQEFISNIRKNHNLDWQYFCSTVGLYRQYPGTYWSVAANEDFYDCRLQPWYIGAASSSKDVQILLDTSGSMTGSRLQVAKKLIEILFDTLTDNDFFNIITYSDESNFLIPQFSDKFVQADKKNKFTFKEALKKFKNTSQQGNLSKSLTKAFGLFNVTSIARSNCNQVILVITDGQQKNDMEVADVLAKWNADKRSRVFSFKIGSDSKNLDIMKQLACGNNGEFYHIISSDSINEHVSKYVAVVSQPMALMGAHETRWSSVFVGYLDKELKIAATSPAFIKHDSLLEEIAKLNIDASEYEIDSHAVKLLEQNDKLNEAAEILINQRVLLGVVGVDVPLLSLISKTTNKYQMGVGPYLFMLDNNGFIVYHPSMGKEMPAKSLETGQNFKSQSFSIDLNKFEVPIENQDEFEMLEHDMIDQKPGQRTLLTWKREGTRLLKRQTEYTYTHIADTPFSIAFASPTSFSRASLHFDPRNRDYYETKLESLQHDFNVNTLIQLANCTYTYRDLIRNLLDPNVRLLDRCLRDLLANEDMLLAVKFDLILHQYIFESMDYTEFLLLMDNPKAARSLFYGSYSGLTFHQTSSFQSQPYLYETEMEASVLSFEKRYYTQTIEFNDYLRSTFKVNQPIVYYSLSEQTDDSIVATLPVWMTNEKIPVAVTGIVYDMKFLKEFLFNDRFTVQQESYENVCNSNAHLNVTCYLLDETGSIIITNDRDRSSVVGRPFYTENPWVMLELETDGFFDLVIPGLELDECNVLPKYSNINSASRLFSFIGLVFRTVVLVANLLVQQIEAYSKTRSDMIRNIERSFENDVKARNAHCSLFGIYTFNITKWLNTDSTIVKTWCNNTQQEEERNYIVGHLKNSNLLMVIVENENRPSQCSVKMEALIQRKRTRHRSHENLVSLRDVSFYPNRYRAKTGHCYNHYPNESAIFKCSLAVRTGAGSSSHSLILVSLIFYFFYF